MECTSSVLDPEGLSIEYIYNKYMRTKISQRVQCLPRICLSRCVFAVAESIEGQ